MSYFQCSNCDFIQTERPYWLSEAYSSAITALDIGLIERNLLLAPKLETLIRLFFKSDCKFIDYGGGYGMLVRMMRDRGLDFYRQDIYCENIFAKNFDVTDFLHQRFELLTAFEVFEHLENPIIEIEKMFAYSDTICFSTELQPQRAVTPQNWWYVVPQTGQHISLYSEKSLRYIAKIHQCNYYSYGSSFHLFTPQKINPILFKGVLNKYFSSFFRQINKKKSLLQTDYNSLLNK